MNSLASWTRVHAQLSPVQSMPVIPEFEAVEDKSCLSYRGVLAQETLFCEAA
jgi:hypothetical protein